MVLFHLSTKKTRGKLKHSNRKIKKKKKQESHFVFTLFQIRLLLTNETTKYDIILILNLTNLYKLLHKY